MNLAIIGSRGFHDYEFLKKEVNQFLEENNFVLDNIVSGGAKGADRMAEIYALEYDINMIVYIADWDLHGKSAGYKRNVQIIDNSDAVIAFWDGSSKGTLHSINLAKEKNKQLKVITT